VEITGTDAMMLTGIFVMVGAVGLTVMTALCATERLGRNSFVGLRSNETLASPSAWSAGHRAALGPVVPTAVIAFLLGAVGTLVPLLWVQAIVVFAGGAILVAGVLLAQRRANTAARGSSPR
jgi:hypothetical protein